MAGLFVSMIVLGLAAVDPAGIAAMPLLLSQKQPYRRSLLFLGGSFVSLMVAGLAFAQGFGATLLHFESAHNWLVPAAEIMAGIGLLGVAVVLAWQLQRGRLSAEPSDTIVKRLQLSDARLFAFGVLLVLIQSVVDVVFAVAMIRVGQMHLPMLALVAALLTYALAALALQASVVIAYRVTPVTQRDKMLARVHFIVTRYANQTVIVVSALLGVGLLIEGVWC